MSRFSTCLGGEAGKIFSLCIFAADLNISELVQSRKEKQQTQRRGWNGGKERGFFTSLPTAHLQGDLDYLTGKPQLMVLHISLSAEQSSGVALFPPL